MSLVLDCSATLAWVYADEINDAVREVFTAVAEEGAVVPGLWRLEIVNALTHAMRQKRIDIGFRNATLADLALLNVEIDAYTDAHAWTQTVSLADKFALTVYDSAYLELAHRRSLPLASLDGELRKAGKALGLELLGA